VGAGGQGVGREGGLSDAQRTVTGLYCLVAVAISFWTPGGAYVGRFFAERDWYAGTLAWHFYHDAIVIAFLIGAIIIGRPSFRKIVGRSPRLGDTTPIALAVVITFLASGAFITLTMVTLSYVLPSFVTWWLDRSYPLVFYVASNGSIPILANIMRLVELIAITPTLEETLFRGYLLHAWVRKWGLWNGVLLSSAVFGAIHPDTVPAMLTGAGFAFIYLRTQSLWAPILAHGVYNAIAAALNVWDLADNKWEYAVPTVADLRSTWWLGVLQLVVVVVLVHRIMRRGALGPLRLPGGATSPGGQSAAP